MSNKKKTTQHYEKKRQEHVIIALMAAFAFLTCSILSTNYIFAYVPTTSEKSGCNPQTDTDCFPDEIVAFDKSSNARLLLLDSQTTGSNTPKDTSVDIEADELVVVGCKGGTEGEVPGKPGVCKEE
ncbi:MAG: hypothetical protein R2685_16235 [Candidatus Nitrosocosmicus sp.]|nr:hypothetical protein [Candidatus Nitrosocosmicus sp.]